MLYQRNILSEIKRVLPREEFIILTGGRQTGKTSVLIMLKSFIEEKGEQCHYFNLENPEHLRLVNEHPFNIFQLIPKSRVRQNIFVDEIQYLDNPTNFLKLLYDQKRSEIKIIASGSSSFYIDKKFKDSLVGRKFLFELYCLDFNEFLIFNDEEELLRQSNRKMSLYYKQKLLKLWQDYLIYGGYPKVVLGEDEGIKRIMLEEIGSSYIKKDISDAGIKNSDKYFSLLKILAAQSGKLLNSQELANTLQMAHKTVEEYLYLMKKSYQVGFIRPFYRNLRKELTKMPKVYFYDLGLRNFFLNDYAPIEKRTDKGAYLENIVFRKILNQTKDIDKIKFWRTQDKNELDFVVGNKAFEVKFNIAGFRESRYTKFKQSYPNIELQLISYESLRKRLLEGDFA